MESWNCYNKPNWNWDCKKCEFLMGISHHTESDKISFHDVYKSCSSLPGHDEYIIVNSNEPGDYHSSITMDNLFFHYIKSHKN